MKETPGAQNPQDKDRQLDIPSEANRDKHINFREAEAGDAGAAGEVDETTRERQRQWREGIEAGKRARDDSEEG